VDTSFSSRIKTVDVRDTSLSSRIKKADIDCPGISSEIKGNDFKGKEIQKGKRLLDGIFSKIRILIRFSFPPYH